MKVSELNRDIKRLGKLAIELSKLNTAPYQIYEQKQNEVKAEFMRLYNVDRELKYINKNSLAILLSINLSHRFVALHTFGLEINLSKHI